MQKYEVEMIYRGASEANNLKDFKEFTRDVRGMAASRSTVKHSKVLPPRLKTASSTKKTGAKPSWR